MLFFSRSVNFLTVTLMKEIKPVGTEKNDFGVMETFQIKYVGERLLAVFFRTFGIFWFCSKSHRLFSQMSL